MLPLLFLLVVALSQQTFAMLLLPSHIASSMVLQRGAPYPLWGLDTVGSTVTVTYGGINYKSVADATGRFSVSLPAGPASTIPSTILIVSTSGGAITLSDILVGDVYLESGQSNAELSVLSTVNYTAAVAAAATYGPLLRLFQVAMLPEYCNVTTPSTNLTASIPWSRASNTSSIAMSALLYYFGVQAVTARPDIPIGIIATSWGGVTIQVWMSPQSLAKCGGALSAMPPSRETLIAAGTVAGASKKAQALAVAAMSNGKNYNNPFPKSPSTLYFSMLYPLLSMPIASLFWYQVREW
jgi:sialate O-acetylesterase